MVADYVPNARKSGTKIVKECRRTTSMQRMQD